MKRARPSENGPHCQATRKSQVFKITHAARSAREGPGLGHGYRVDGRCAFLNFLRKGPAPEMREH